MATKRTPLQRGNRHKVNDAARAAFEAGDRSALHAALGLPPWIPSPLEIEGKSPWPAGAAGAEFWPLAQGLRSELEAHR